MSANRRNIGIGAALTVGVVFLIAWLIMPSDTSSAPRVPQEGPPSRTDRSHATPQSGVAVTAERTEVEVNRPSTATVVKVVAAEDGEPLSGAVVRACEAYVDRMNVAPPGGPTISTGVDGSVSIDLSRFGGGALLVSYPGRVPTAVGVGKSGRSLIVVPLSRAITATFVCFTEDESEPVERAVIRLSRRPIARSLVGAGSSYESVASNALYAADTEGAIFYAVTGVDGVGLVGVPAEGDYYIRAEHVHAVALRNEESVGIRLESGAIHIAWRYMEAAAVSCAGDSIIDGKIWAAPGPGGVVRLETGIRDARFAASAIREFIAQAHPGALVFVALPASPGRLDGIRYAGLCESGAIIRGVTRTSRVDRLQVEWGVPGPETSGSIDLELTVGGGISGPTPSWPATVILEESGLRIRTRFGHAINVPPGRVSVTMSVPIPFAERKAVADSVVVDGSRTSVDVDVSGLELVEVRVLPADCDDDGTWMTLSLSRVSDGKEASVLWEDRDGARLLSMAPGEYEVTGQGFQRHVAECRFTVLESHGSSWMSPALIQVTAEYDK